MGRNRRLAPRFIEPVSKQDLDADRAAARARRQAAFADRMPEEYRDRLLTDLPDPALVTALRGWYLSDGKFLWLSGESYTGKTLTLWAFARRADTDGIDWHLLSASDYLSARKGFEDKDIKKRAHTARLLLLDEWPLNVNSGGDLDYVRDLSNARRANGLRTVVTANGAPGLGTALLNHQHEATREAAKAVNNRLTSLFEHFPITHQPWKG